MYCFLASSLIFITKQLIQSRSNNSFDSSRSFESALLADGGDMNLAHVTGEQTWKIKFGFGFNYEKVEAGNVNWWFTESV